MSSDDGLGVLDPDDPRQPSQQIANLLRAAILTKKLGPGEKVPSQPELAARYGVARETVKRALDILTAERLIVRRQGSGTFVRAQIQRPVELRPHIEAAFEHPHVTIDFAGFSGETLGGAVGEALDKVRAGRLTPQSIALRLLVADTDGQLTLPVAVRPEDADRVRARAEQTTRRAIEGLIANVEELADLGLVASSAIEVKTVGSGSLFKLYVLNGSEVFFGFYPAIERSVRIGADQIPIYDLLGKDVPLYHYAIDDQVDSHGSQFVQGAKDWFESIWHSVAKASRP